MIGIIMPQLNVLPINASQNVETKGESAALISTSSKDDFSQHIDMHLAKNRDVSNSTKKETAHKSDENTVKNSHEHSRVKSDDAIKKNSDDSLMVTDEVDSANSAQEVAASGKKTENELSKAKPSEEIQQLDESELLMSFLVKADQTLIAASSDESISIGGMSAEKKAKLEAQLLLKSSDLVANLSDIAKALKPNLDNTSEGITDKELLAKALLTTSKSNKTDENQVDENTLIELEDEESNNVKDKRLTKGNVERANVDFNNKMTNGDLVSNDKNTAKLVEESTKNSLAGSNKVTESTLNAGNQGITNKDLVNNISSKVSEGVTQKELNKPFLTSEIKSDESIKVKLTATPTVNAQAVTHSQSSLEFEARANEQMMQLAQSSAGITKQDASPASAFSTAQNSHQNKKLSAASLGKTSAEILMKENDLVDSEEQLNAKSVEHLVEQSKQFSAGENKDASNKTPVKTTADLSVNSNFTDIIGRATQTPQEVVDQHAAEIFNPIGSSEVSQGQKTNTQLHQETISIFRRDFADAVKDRVMLMISQKLQQFDITLDPPELGNMHVRVNLQGDQATVNFVVQNQQAKEAFEQNMHKLKELLADQGVDVGDANVEQQSQQSDNEANNDENSGDNQHNSITNTADASDVIEHSLSARMINSSTAAVDYYA